MLSGVLNADGTGLLNPQNLFTVGVEWGDWGEFGTQLAPRGRARCRASHVRVVGATGVTLLTFFQKSKKVKKKIVVERGQGGRALLQGRGAKKSPQSPQSPHTKRAWYGG
jgi:hypothetical protein